MTEPGLPAGFPDDWVSANLSVGNSTNAHLSDVGLPIAGVPQGGVLTFDPAQPFGDDQKVLNIFYYCCYMHDFSYLLGFREASGNFQQNDFGRGGTQGDPVDARSWPGAVFGTANMSHPIDGTSPVMNMGLVTSTNRHTAFDSTVVFHEFTHGISNRLVGGPLNSSALEAEQSGSMGEGWSDYMACTINNVTVLGNWILDNAGGIRGFPYDANFPDHFGNIGTGRYNEVHNVGEIWCATLMEMNRRTERHFAVQLVIDALKLTPANPNFLQARDAILTALANKLAAGQINNNQHDGAWQGIWSAFAKFGMGPQATSTGAHFGGVVADFTIGQDNWRWCSKCQGLWFGGNAGSHCPVGGSHIQAGSGNYDLVMGWAAAPGQANWRWCHKCQGLYFAGNPGSHCPAGGAHENVGSGDYKLIFNAWVGSGQRDWRWCNKCQGLYFGGNPGSHCPAGGAHDHTGSGDYSLIIRS
jgi:extracellular elastinolytic metalloproteinase